MKVAASMVVGTKEKIMVIQVGEEQHFIVLPVTTSLIYKLDKNLDVPVKGEQHYSSNKMVPMRLNKTCCCHGGKAQPEYGKE